MVQIQHSTAPQKMPNFQFSRRENGRDKILGAPQRSQKIIVNQCTGSGSYCEYFSYSLDKPFIRRSFRQNYFSREIEWAVSTETAS